MAVRYPWFVRNDLDGFFGLAIDNLIQLMLISLLCTTLLGIPETLLFGVILPAAAVSIFFGNFFYFILAGVVSRRSQRTDVTALPYGINTVSLLAYVYFIMLPVYRESKNPVLTWQVGVLACFGSGLIEFFGAFIVNPLRRIIPRAALLSGLAGIAITFISMDFVFRMFEKPLLALIPFSIIMAQYFSHQRLPLGIPAGLIALLIGTGLGFLLKSLGLPFAVTQQGLFLPSWHGGVLLGLLGKGYFPRFSSIILPMGLFNLIGSLQNIESAEASGDKYPAMPALAINGIGSLLASFLGSCFPTTIYIGHPGWKALGARRGYSLLSGVFFCIICFTGILGWILRWVPFEAGIGILLYIGVVIMAQAFQESPKGHAVAVAVGIIPALAAWGLLLIENTLRAQGTSLPQLGLEAFQGFLPIRGIIHLERGFVFTSMILASISVCLIERQFARASLWSLVAAALSFLGVIHTFQLGPDGVTHRFGLGTGLSFAVAYLAVAGVFFLLHVWNQRRQ